MNRPAKIGFTLLDLFNVPVLFVERVHSVCKTKRSSDNRNLTGFTLVETIVALGVFLIFFSSIAYIVQSILHDIGTARVRAVALSIVQEKMETVRNLSYTNVGTVGGIPAGPIAQSQVITKNGLAFTVTTSIIYIDDTFDGVAPSDPIPADYKRVRIQATWGGVFPSITPMTEVSNIAPNGIESNPGGGTLYIRVFNALGQPVSNASVTITNSVVTPSINFSTLTTAQGNAILPGAPACVSCYSIAVTKSGYSTDRTYATSEVANPLQPLVTVIAGQVSQASFAIDLVGSLSVHSVGSQSSGYPTIVNVIFTLKGSKIIGYDTTDNPVYKYNFQTTTGGGTVGIPNLEWDNYTVDLSNSNYTLAGSIPLLPMQLGPASASSVIVVGEPKYSNSLLVTAKDSLANLLPGATASLSSSLLGVNFVKLTGATGAADMGQAFFNNLSSSTYSLNVSLPGHITATASMSLSGNKQTIMVLN